MTYLLFVSLSELGMYTESQGHVYGMGGQTVEPHSAFPDLSVQLYASIFMMRYTILVQRNQNIHFSIFMIRVHNF